MQRAGTRRGAVGAGLALVAAVAAKPAQAALNRANAGGNPYGDVMINKGGLSVDQLYEDKGGACGKGYELRVRKVLGSDCVCIDQEICGEGAAGERREISAEERAFGKKTAPEASNGIQLNYLNED